MPDIPENETVEQISAESMVKVIDEKLKKLEQNDFLTINIRKTGAYIFLGLVAVVLWLMPVINYGINKIFSGKFNPAVVEASPSPSPIPVEKIRVRLGSDSLTEAQEVERLLNSAGFNQLEFWYDDKINAGTVMVVTKKEDVELTNKLVAALDKTYKMASGSAVLTEDSDFKATILVGKNSKRV